VVGRTLEALPPSAQGARLGLGRRSTVRSSRVAIRASTATVAMVLFCGVAAAALLVAERVRPPSRAPAAVGAAAVERSHPTARARSMLSRPTLEESAPTAPPPAGSALPVASASSAASVPPVASAPPASSVPPVASAPATPPTKPPLARARAKVSAQAARVVASGKGDVSPPASAGELFLQANRARREGRAADAAALYDLLWTRHRASEEARASRAIVGRWLLDRGAYAPAAAAFRDYLDASSRGPLEEEALVGLASALERTGRRAEAATAWQRLLASHPETAHAARARQHLAHLSEGAVPASVVP